jgi:hypothetical protein
MSRDLVGRSFSEVASKDIVFEQVYSLLGVTLRVRFTSREQEALVHPILSHLRVDDQAPHLVFEIVQHGGAFVVFRDGNECASCKSLVQLAPLIKGEVWSAAINAQEFFLGVHAGVVGTNSGCILIAGNSGTGKSTLTAVLMNAGYQYFSDEFALLHADLQVTGVPLALCVKRSGLEPLVRYYPELCVLPVHTRFDGKQVVYLPPSRASFPELEQPNPVRGAVFPIYSPGAPAVCRALGKTEALRRLFAYTVVCRNINAQRIQALLAWLDDAALIELTFGAAEDCVPLLASIFGGNDNRISGNPQELAHRRGPPQGRLPAKNGERRRRNV